MTDDDKLAALFSDHDASIEDDGFTQRVLALAALDDRLAARRRADLVRVVGEAAALVGVLALFAGLARLTPTTDVVPLASPAMVGLLLLTLWLAIGVRGTARGV